MSENARTTSLLDCFCGEDIVKGFSRWEFEVGCEATLRKTPGLIRYLVIEALCYPKVAWGRDRKRSLTYWDVPWARVAYGRSKEET